jgi:hypothetical protein
MTDDDQRSRLTRRTEEHAMSLWYTYNQHFAAANFYRYVANGIDLATIGLGGVLTYSLIWKVLPMRAMAGFAVLTAVLTGIRAAIRPEQREERLRQSARQYHRLFDETRDFLTLTLPDGNTPIGEIQSRYEGTAEQRRDFNDELPDVSSLWYHYIKFFKGSDGLDEVTVTEAERARLTEER